MVSERVLLVKEQDVHDWSFWAELAGQFPSNFVSMNIVAVCDGSPSLTVVATLFRVHSWKGKEACASFAGI